MPEMYEAPACDSPFNDRLEELNEVLESIRAMDEREMNMMIAGMAKSLMRETRKDEDRDREGMGMDDDMGGQIMHGMMMGMCDYSETEYERDECRRGMEYMMMDDGMGEYGMDYGMDGKDGKKDRDGDYGMDYDKDKEGKDRDGEYGDKDKDGKDKDGKDKDGKDKDGKDMDKDGKKKKRCDKDKEGDFFGGLLERFEMYNMMKDDYEDKDKEGMDGEYDKEDKEGMDGIRRQGRRLRRRRKGPTR